MQDQLVDRQAGSDDAAHHFIGIGFFRQKWRRPQHIGSNGPPFPEDVGQVVLCQFAGLARRKRSICRPLWARMQASPGVQRLLFRKSGIETAA
jgi:hypothetical protein